MTQAATPVLTCPSCGTVLQHDVVLSGYICSKENIIYPIRQHIPVLLIDQAEPYLLEEDQ